MVSGLFIAIPGIMDQLEYIKILEQVVLLYAEEEIPLKWVFQTNFLNSLIFHFSLLFVK